MCACACSCLSAFTSHPAPYLRRRRRRVQTREYAAVAAHGVRRRGRAAPAPRPRGSGRPEQQARQRGGCAARAAVVSSQQAAASQQVVSRWSARGQHALLERRGLVPQAPVGVQRVDDGRPAHVVGAEEVLLRLVHLEVAAGRALVTPRPRGNAAGGWVRPLPRADAAAVAVAVARETRRVGEAAARADGAAAEGATGWHACDHACDHAHVCVCGVVSPWRRLC